MTLFRQIAILFSIFIILVISSVMYLNFKSANDFIQNQLYTTSQDTATSLGLSLSMVIPEDNDLSTMQTMINAIFDRGYYESIILYDTKGKVLIENKNKLKVKGVPQWFIDKVKLNVPIAKSQVMAGWMPYGTIAVKVHSGLAYQQLWKIFIDILRTFAILVSLALLALYILLKIVLKPLEGVEKQAKAIMENNFIVQEKLPFTTEFRHVVIAMNKMVMKVKEIFEHEAALVKKYNDLLYKDQDTGIGNRKYFLLRLSSLLEHEDNKSNGTVVIFVINGFFEIKRAVEYEKLHSYVKEICNLLQNTTKDIEERVVARLKDAEFSVILPDTDYKKTKSIMEDFIAKAEKIKKETVGDFKNLFIVGGATYYSEKDNIKNILSRADFAISIAKMKNESFVEFHKMEKEPLPIKSGKQEWYRFLNDALNKNGIKLALQSVKNLDTKET
ncbi:MAG: diguanylate cyclase, partial [Epsilonproteobacteria bacterium]|nr:diguanylate cyclase [Campylobacterota bacterium]